MWTQLSRKPVITRTALVLLAAAILIGIAIGGWLLSAPQPIFPSRGDARAAAELEQGGDASRGRLIFAAADCASCHASPGQPDPLRLGGGMALAAPFGTLRIPNISQDRHDGIGKWRTADLANALLSGVSPSGAHYYPALPYTSYTHMTLEDVRDLMAYLRTLPAVPGKPPGHDIPFPFSVRRLIGFWKLLYFKRSPLPSAPTHDATWHRGRYLVEALGHCAECHSRRNVLGAIEPSWRFAGGEDPEGVGFAPNITPGALGGWSRADLSTFLRTGQTPDLRIVGSSMVDVLANTAILPESDRQAMATYLITLPARSTSPP